MRSKTALFASKLLQWADRIHIDRRARQKMSSALRNTMRMLEDFDGHVDLTARVVDIADAAPVWIRAPEVWAYPSSGGTKYLVAVTQPAWSDLRIGSGDEMVDDSLQGFFHLATQYVARSRQLAATIALAATYSAAPDLRHGNLYRVRIDAKRGLEQALAEVWRSEHLEKWQPQNATSGVRRSSGRELRAWTASMNTLDPYLHRACFQYWRARALANANFWEESISALDCLAAVAGEAVQRWLHLDRAPQRDELVQHLKLPQEDAKGLSFVYELRCAFGAHAAHAKWWDFAEVCEDELDQAWDSASRVLRALGALERTVRSVDPSTRRQIAGQSGSQAVPIGCTKRFGSIACPELSQQPAALGTRVRPKNRIGQARCCADQL